MSTQSELRKLLLQAHTHAETTDNDAARTLAREAFALAAKGADLEAFGKVRRSLRVSVGTQHPDYKASLS